MAKVIPYPSTESPNQPMSEAVSGMYRLASTFSPTLPSPVKAAAVSASPIHPISSRYVRREKWKRGSRPEDRGAILRAVSSLVVPSGILV